MKIAIIALLLCFVLGSFAASGDIAALDFIAAAPYTYDHTTGGGAYNDRTIGETADTVESLEGPELACGDYVTYLLSIRMEEVTVVDADNTVKIEVQFLADSTGQSGVGFGNVQSVSLNMGDVENGNGGGTAANPGAGSYGADGGYVSNGDETVTVTFEEISGPLFVSGSVLDCHFTVTGLNAGETIIVRMDVELFCQPNSSPTGNLQGALMDATNFVGSTDKGSVSGGQQTIPLKTVSKIQGLDECIPSGQLITAGESFTASIVYYDPGMTQDGFVTGTLTYSWDLGAYAITGASNGITTIHTFDTACTYNHDGEYLFSTGECGCEETFIGDNQPQFFLDLNTDYWNLDSATPEDLGGRATIRYTAAGSSQNIQYIWLDASTDELVKVQYSDAAGGRIIEIVSITYGAVDATVFNPPVSTCYCRRDTDLVILLDKADVIDEEYLQVALFAGAIRDNFFIEGEPSNTHLGVIEFTDVTTEVLHINNGHLYTTVNSAINSLDCVPGVKKTACFSGTSAGNAAAAINAGVAMLDESVRSVTQSLLIVTNNWDMGSALDTAVAAAAAKGITIYAVVWRPPYLLEQMLPLVNNVRDNLVWRYTIEELVTVDPIDVFSKICTTNHNPCDACCGLCDTACGTCVAVECPVSSGCAFETYVNGDGCCATRTSDSGCQATFGQCETVYCDAGTDECVSNGPGSACPADDACYTWTCNPATDQCTSVFNGAGLDNECFTAECVAGAVVMVDTNPCGTTGSTCYDISCDNTTGCELVPVPNFDSLPVCNPQCANDADCAAAAPNDCYAYNCNTNVCEYTLSCNDANPCTLDKCDSVAGACTHTDKDCGLPDMCIEFSCDTASGDCVSQTRVCDDNNDCTIDSCSPDTGCVFTADDTVCESADPCKVPSCDATPGGGCVFETFACPSTGDFCTAPVCEPFVGCVDTPIDCEERLNGTSGECIVYTCNEDTDECEATALSCAVSAVVVASAAIGTGLLIGIIIAAIVGFTVVGGGAYAAVQATANNSSSTVTNNPLYEGAGKSGVNPLHHF